MANRKVSQGSPRNKSTNAPHFEIENCGSLCLLRLLNPVATNWMHEHLPMESDETQFWGSAIVIEPRYLAPIVDGILADGLVLR
jgi:hypothetical protein